MACITGPRRLSTANERLRGYRDGLAAAGVAFDESLVVREDFRQAGGHQAVLRLFDGGRGPGADALFVANNEMTVGALQALRELGRRVPHDVAVAGFDDTPWATLMDPPLTVVAQPTYQIGHTAADLLATAAGRAPDQVVLPARLIVRGTSSFGGKRKAS